MKTSMEKSIVWLMMEQRIGAGIKLMFIDSSSWKKAISNSVISRARWIAGLQLLPEWHGGRLG